ncbi:hypothetical protein B7P43_G09655 [Cryptotermes secundus]|uniref:DDE Tnp4 domain-containing protein n=1 Tax=Cryptotermes secundus TaxID=105785 RepID=A0A2J7Q728_9NEOP|nr:hypothetical protein B7P43_G09655 [Cryptotermes secundus]
MVLQEDQPKRIWVHDINKKRNEFGEFHTIFHDLTEDDKKFFIYFCMSYAKFCELLLAIEPRIEKKNTNFREAITPRERLAVTLRVGFDLANHDGDETWRIANGLGFLDGVAWTLAWNVFLGQGDTFRVIALTYRMGETTVRRIVYETCEVIWEVLSPIVMPPPTKEIWGHISSRIWDKWQYPNALGAMDGKNVVFEKPGGSGSTFFNYKKEFSIVLLALVDADYKFIVVDVGAHGRTSDGAVFFRSRLGKMLTEGTLDIPVPKSLPNEPEIVLPHVIVADEAFPLQENIMRPYPGPQVVNNEPNKIYNYRHSRFRRVSENAFGILSKKFRIYQ